MRTIEPKPRNPGDPTEEISDLAAVAEEVAALARASSEASPGFLDDRTAHSVVEPWSRAAAIQLATVAPAAGIRLLAALSLRTLHLADRDASRAFDAVRRRLARDHGGSEVASADGLFLFQRPIQALRCALSCLNAAADADLPVHGGLHLGEVLVASAPSQAPTVHAKGSSLDVAVDLRRLAGADQVLVSPEARALARRAMLDDRVPDGAHWHQHGTFYLEALEEAVPVTAVSLAAAHAARPPADTDNARRVPDRPLHAAARS
jgi:class 3 adenylate cyclase